MTDDVNKRLAAAFFDTDLIASRIILAMAEFIWAAMLWWPGDTFGRPTYHHMSRVMSEDAWGLVFMLSAVTQINIIAMGHFCRSYARLFAGWNSVLWVYIVFSMLLSVYPPPAAISGEIALMVAACWIWAKPAVIHYFYRKAYAEQRQQQL